MVNRIVMVAIAAVVLVAAVARSHGAVVKTGAEVAVEAGFPEFAGKRIGLITNHTAMVGERHLIDLLHDSGKVVLAALFAPEHGLRGLEEDGVVIAGGRDDRTGVKIHSLYGRAKKPSQAMLEGIDLLVFDIQDVGARFYTFISTMGHAMEAAAAAGIPFVVLDRPNPLGGEYVAGPVVEKRFLSFVGLYPIPVVHGMTVGELAGMIRGERLLPGVDRLDLRIVRMAGWQRSMQWPDTGLPWVRTSPNIPDFDTALLYPGLCFLEATKVSEGRGTLEPFRLAGAPWLGDGAAAEVAAARLPGVRVEEARFIPRVIKGMSSRPKFANKLVTGMRITVQSRQEVEPVELAVHVLSAVYRRAGIKERERFFQQPGFDLLAGSDRLRESLGRGEPPESIISGWKDEERRFRERRLPYLLY